ncbi:MAG: ABC-F family ATP-binding cassette domain-containing protein [Mollicutes bacterium]|nr:ABC-F family ATP-binding cassette domain-containing protein [Mollicutes bacterium]
MLITFNNVSLQYTDKRILDNVSFTINDNAKLGIIGINGAGKSSILKLIVGEFEPSSGVIYRKNDLKMGYLSQEVTLYDDKTIFEETKRLSKNENDYEISSILNKLGLMDHNKQVRQISGGERKRLQLASVLISKTDMLILDEPTNHLDIAMIAWLEKYLIKYNKAIILVTHDRYFLERITSQIMEIENGKVYLYDANYSGFLTLKTERMEYLKANERKLSSILKKEAKWMAMNPQARSTKSRERIERFYNNEDALKNIKTSIKASTKEMEFSSKKSRMGKKTIILDNIDLTMDGKTLVKNFSYIVNKYDRLGIVGNNGCGKTTLFNSIISPKEPQIDKIVIGETINIGYFKQTDKIMDSNIKVIDYLKEYGEYIDTKTGKISASQLLENYFFTPTMQQMPVSRLSGGEKRRLSLLKVLITNPNVLFLDEPTNDLDIYTIEILEDYLEDFSGAVLVVSHDRYFLDKVCDHLLIFDNKEINEYMFSITEYLESNNFELTKQEEKVKQVVKKDIPRFTSQEKKEYDHIEETISNLENDISEIEQQLQTIDTDYELIIKLNNQKQDLEKKLEEKINRWEYLEEINQKIILYKENKNYE